MSNSIIIESSTVQIQLSDVSISSVSAFHVSNSDLALIFRGRNTLTSTATSAPGLECSDESNITLQAASGGSLAATAGWSGAGIGTGENGVCGSVTIMNGSIEAKGGNWGPGIDTGMGDLIISVREH